MGFVRASEMALSGRLLLGDEAASGLVDFVVEPDRVVDEAVSIAATIGANAAPQLRMIKDLLTLDGSDTDLACVH